MRVHTDSMTKILQKDGYFGKLLGILAASLLGSVLAGKGVIRSSEGD